jgi:hypothetical protein
LRGIEWALGTAHGVDLPGSPATFIIHGEIPTASTAAAPDGSSGPLGGRSVEAMPPRRRAVRSRPVAPRRPPGAAAGLARVGRSPRLCSLAALATRSPPHLPQDDATTPIAAVHDSAVSESATDR